tara:strand:+ start:31 stop:1848 length:1818 start_codon:yes stop_codon:yes gene_type:complete
MNEEELTEEGLTDPYESELKKEKERYEAQNQEAYDKTIENEIKRKREAEKKKGLLDEGSAFRTTAAIGSEIALNSILDIFSFEPTSQVAGGAFINYLAQKIRGGEISKGELAAAGLASLIPGGAQGKALTKVAKSIGKGAVSGGIEVTGQKVVDEGRLPTAGELGTGLAVGGAFGGIFQTAADSKFIEALSKRVRNPLDDALTVYAMSPSRKGGFTDEVERLLAKIQDDLTIEKGKQLGLFSNEGDAFLYAKYKAQNKEIGTPLPKRQQAGRALRPTDFDDIIAENPEITPDLIFSYIESVKAGKLGKPKFNPATKRFIRNQKGLEGTLRFLNQKAAPDPNFDLSSIAAELSAEFNRPITPKTLLNIIDENVRQGSFTFKTQGMSKPVEIKNIDDLRKAYLARVARYKNIPAFERGHVFAADNIIKDNKVANLTDFKNNLEPEIARSIYRQLDDEALDELIRLNVDNNFEDIESLYEQILAGNRSRKNLDDPDKVIAALYGRDYGLRESFLNFVYPDRSLGRLIPPDLKAAFTDLYQRELAQRLSAYKGLSIGPGSLDKIRAEVARDVLKSFPDVDTRFVLEQMTLASDKAFGKQMVDELTGEAL